MRNSTSDPKPDEARVALVREELEQTIMKVNLHLHSGYEHNDMRQPESIFMNFLKKQPSVIHSAYIMRLKNRDFKMSLDKDRYISQISFTDCAYETFNGMISTVNLLNAACVGLDYVKLRKEAHSTDKFFQITNKIIQNIKDFKF
jgi:hypothetical protein